MRKFLLSLLAVALLGAGSAFAQGMSSQYWAGFSAGYPGATIHFGVENVIESLDIRANLGFTYFGSGLSFGADVLYGLAVDTGELPIAVYLGGGPIITLGLGAGGGLGVGINALVGAEYSLADVGFEPGGVFFEVGPVLNVVPTFNAGFVGRLGFNYHFQ